MSSSYVTLVTRAIKALGPQPGGYTAADLAAAVGETRDTMTVALAQHRQQQNRVESEAEFIVVCEGYGSGAHWFVLHANDTAYISRPARRKHGKYIVRDAVVRFLRDKVMELDPALSKRSRATDKVVLEAAKQAMAQLDAVAEGMTRQMGLTHEPITLDTKMVAES